jgi:hypothetical protein
MKHVVLPPDRDARGSGSPGTARKPEKAIPLSREVTDALAAAHLKGLADKCIAKAKALKCATNSSN